MTGNTRLTAQKINYGNVGSVNKLACKLYDERICFSRFESEDPASQLRLVFEIRLQAILVTVRLTKKSPTCNSFRQST